jgi:hypothetical protein
MLNNKDKTKLKVGMTIYIINQQGYPEAGIIKDVIPDSTSSNPGIWINGKMFGKKGKFYKYMSFITAGDRIFSTFKQAKKQAIQNVKEEIERLESQQFSIEEMKKCEK